MKKDDQKIPMEQALDETLKENASAAIEPEKTQDENYEKWVRLSADFDNFRKRTQKEKSDLIRFGNENLLKALLPVLDNFERAVTHSKSARDVDAIAKGVEMILFQLMHTLEQFGLKTQSSLGESFDPKKHDAVAFVEKEGAEPGSVVEEFQKVYFLFDRLLRPASVSVAKLSERQATDMDLNVNGEEEPKGHA